MDAPAGQEASNRTLNRSGAKANPGPPREGKAGVAPLLLFLFVTLAQLTSLSAARLPLLTPLLACCAPFLTSLLAGCAPFLASLRPRSAPFLAPLCAASAPLLPSLGAGLRSGLLCHLLGCLLGRPDSLGRRWGGFSI